MFPELIEIAGITIHSYGFMIMLGAIMGFWFMSTSAKKELGIVPDKIQSLAILIIVGAFVGGKALFYLNSDFLRPLINGATLSINFRLFSYASS